MLSYTVVIERDEDGFYVGSCPAFPGCFTQGRTQRQVMARIRSLIPVFVRIRREQGEPLPCEIGTERVRVVAS